MEPSSADPYSSDYLVPRVLGEQVAANIDAVAELSPTHLAHGIPNRSCGIMMSPVECGLHFNGEVLEYIINSSCVLFGDKVIG